MLQTEVVRCYAHVYFGFKMLKQVIFGLLGEHLPGASFSQNAESQGAWTKFLQLAAGAIKNQSWTK